MRSTFQAIDRGAAAPALPSIEGLLTGLGIRRRPGPVAFLAALLGTLVPWGAFAAVFLDPGIVRAGGSASTWQYSGTTDSFAQVIEQNNTDVRRGYELAGANYSLVATFGNATVRAEARPGVLRTGAGFSTGPAADYDPTRTNAVTAFSFADWSEGAVVGNPVGIVGPYPATFRGRLRVSSQLNSSMNVDATANAPLEGSASSTAGIDAISSVYVQSYTGEQPFPFLTPATTVLYAVGQNGRYRNIAAEATPAYFPVDRAYISTPDYQVLTGGFNREYFFEVPVTTDQLFWFTVGLQCSAASGADFEFLASAPTGSARCNAMQSLEWAGMDLLDSEGNVLDLSQFSVQSASGFDLTRPVPGPETGLLMGTGLLTLIPLALRRRKPAFPGNRITLHRAVAS